MKKNIYLSLLASVVIILQGCGTFQEPPRQVNLYTLAYPSPDAGAPGKVIPARLSVRPFLASAPYRTDSMVYAENKYHRSTYVYHKWLTKPAEIVGDLILRDIRAAQLVEAAFYDGIQNPTHIMKCTLEEFYEDDSREPWEAVLGLNLILIKNDPAASGSRIVLQKTYRVRKKLEQKSALGLAKAISRAVQEVSTRIVKDIRTGLGTF